MAHALTQSIMDSIQQTDQEADPQIRDYVAGVMGSMTSDPRTELAVAVLTECYRAGDHLATLRTVLPQLSEPERDAISEELAAIKG